MKPLPVIVLVVSLTLSGCSLGRVANLEKENKKLKDEISKAKAADYDRQVKCGHDAAAWFKEHWNGDKDTILLDYRNHYYKAQNKCIILVEYHFHLDGADWSNVMAPYDVYENVKLGHFSSRHKISKPKYDASETVDDCEVYGTKCETIEEFNNL